MIANLLTMPVEVDLISQTGPDDRYNNPTDEVVTVQALGYLEQTQRVQTGADGDVLQEKRRLYLSTRDLAGDPIPLDGWDAIRYNGTPLYMEGPPWEAFNPRTRVVHHIECDVRRSE